MEDWGLVLTIVVVVAFIALNHAVRPSWSQLEAVNEPCPALTERAGWKSPGGEVVCIPPCWAVVHGYVVVAQNLDGSPVCSRPEYMSPAEYCGLNTTWQDPCVKAGYSSAQGGGKP